MKKLMEELDKLHNEDKHKEIIDKINSLPEDQLDYEILGRLARAYNNNEEYQKGIEIMEKIRDKGEQDSIWNYRMGYSYYYLDNLPEAEKYFLKSLELNPYEEDVEFFLLNIHIEMAEKYIQSGEKGKALENYMQSRLSANTDDEIMLTESN